MFPSSVRYIYTVKSTKEKVGEKEVIRKKVVAKVILLSSLAQD